MRMEQRLSIVTLVVKEIGKSLLFYQEMGLKPAFTDHETVVFFQMGGFAFALFRDTEFERETGVQSGSANIPRSALAYNVREKHEVDQILSQAEIAGGKRIKSGVDREWGGYSGYFSDPDGHIWEVAWNPSFAMGENGEITLPGPPA